jgi:hypothetical protein
MSYQDRGVQFIRYYWCVFCGNTGDFKFERERNIKCECCGYEYVTELDEEEYEKSTNKPLELVKMDNKGISDHHVNNSIDSIVP